MPTNDQKLDAILKPAAEKYAPMSDDEKAKLLLIAVQELAGGTGEDENEIIAVLLDYSGISWGVIESSCKLVTGEISS